MKLLPLIIGSLVAGAVLGVALASYDVGEVENAFYPPLDEALVGIGDGSGPDNQPTGPVVEVDDVNFDFGTMQRGSTESHEFLFTNSGTTPLRLEVGRTTCKCTLGEVVDRPLAPGESTPVRLEWVAKSGGGQFRQTATVLTNDPRKPQVELTVEGLITDVTGLQPREFLLGRLAADVVGEASVFLASYEEGPDATPLEATARMSDTTPSADRFEFVVEPVAAEDLPIERATSGVRITVKAGPGLPIGSLTEWVSVETNLADKQGEDGRGLVLQVPLLGRVEGDISIHGAGWSKERNLLNLGNVRSSAGRESKLLLSFKGDHAADLRAELGSADPEWLGVELGEPKRIRDGVYHQPMTVRIPPGRSSQVRSGAGDENGGIGDGDARIRLSVNHPSTSELDVKVRFVIAE